MKLLTMFNWNKSNSYWERHKKSTQLQTDQWTWLLLYNTLPPVRWCTNHALTKQCSTHLSNELYQAGQSHHEDLENLFSQAAESVDVQVYGNVEAAKSTQADLAQYFCCCIGTLFTVQLYCSLDPTRVPWGPELLYLYILHSETYCQKRCSTMGKSWWQMTNYRRNKITKFRIGH